MAHDHGSNRQAMAGMTTDPRVSESVENFSRIIIQTLKELSANHHPLSLSHLSKALGEKSEIINLFNAAANADHPAPADETAETDTDSSVNGKVKTLQNQKEQLLKQVTLLEEQNLEAKAFCRKSLLTLANLSSFPENSAHFHLLERLRKLLHANAELSDLDLCLSDIKDLMLQNGANGGSSKTQEAGLLGKWLKKREPSQGRQSANKLQFKHLQSNLLSIIAEFHLDLGKEYLERFSSLQRRIRESSTIDQLLGLNGDLTSLIQDYIKLMNDERSQITDFIEEIGKSLIEMESNFMTSVSYASEAHQSNVDFNNLLEGQMEEIKRSTYIGKTLQEIRGFVSSRITSIKAALETKRQEDQRRMAEMNNEMGVLQQNLQNMRKEIDQVQEQSKSLERETLLDPLTGIPNRRAYDVRIREELQRHQRYQQSFSLLLFDVDHFKGVNDNYGHWAGDKCLKEIIRRIKPVMRESDFLARYGGEEFVIILPGTDRDSAMGVAERLRQIIEKTHFLYQGQKIPLTISVGVTHTEPSDRDQATLFNRVDDAMYQAKRAGRNKVVLV